MITNLHIRNLGIIKDIDVELGEGFNVLTGETGAGKTLIIDALNLLSGGRFSKEMIRNKEEEVLIEANIFDGSKISEEEKNVVVSRKISFDGKNICKINGRLVSIRELKKYMQNVIDIHSQNDNQKLFDKKYHIELLDNFSNEILEIKYKYLTEYNEYISIKKQLQENFGDDSLRIRNLDIMRYQLNEIEEAGIIESEEELEAKKKKIQNREKIITNMQSVEYEFENNIINSFENVMKNFSKLSGIDEEYESKYNLLESSYYEMKEVMDFTRDVLCNLNNDGFEDEKILNRIDLINKLKRKYGGSIEEIERYKEDLKDKISKIENLDDYINKLKLEEESIKKTMTKIAYTLSEERKKVASKLSGLINKELLDMDMKNVNVNIEVTYDNDDEFTATGRDSVEFLIKTNLGGEYLPLAKIASGGEMSRVMLAIKTVFLKSYNISTVVFDEIDVGISGMAATKVAKKMEKLSKEAQVICVTHLANVAALADNNLYIYKENLNNKETATRIKKLSGEEKIREVARISFGKITEVAIKYAYELQKEKFNI